MKTSSKKQISNIPKEFSWEGPSHQEQQRSPAWYLAFGLASLLGIGFALFYERSITTVITFALIIIVVFFLASQPQRKTTYKISSMGLSANRTLYPMPVVKKFWIDYNPPEVKTFNFETTAYLNSKVSFQLGDADPVTVRRVARQYLPEDLDHDYSIRETLAKKLKI
jgi:hypothetical protein